MSIEAADRARHEGKKNIAASVLNGCGHDLGAPVSPTTLRTFRGPTDNAIYSYGGRPKETWLGQKAAWSALLDYLAAADGYASGERHGSGR
jgi:hypothetical protein